VLVATLAIRYLTGHYTFHASAPSHTMMLQDTVIYHMLYYYQHYTFHFIRCFRAHERV